MGNVAVDEPTLAYIAGVVDLLGNIKVRELDNGTRLPQVQIHGDHMRTLTYLGELTETKAIVARRSYARAGCAEHCKEKHQHIESRSGRWSLTGVKATIVLWNIRPYLRVQADAAIEAINVGTSTRFKPGVVSRMRELGWQIPELDPPQFQYPECKVKGCDKEAHSRGWCYGHHARWRRHGDPLAGGPARSRA